MESIYKAAREEYKKLSKEPIYCPALRHEVVFSKYGWNHLIGGTELRKRTDSEVLERLSLIFYVNQILIDNNAKLKNSYRGKRKFCSLEKIFEGSKELRIVIEILDRNLYKFYSIMKIKN